MKVYIDKKNKFIEKFDARNGVYIRSVPEFNEDMITDSKHLNRKKRWEMLLDEIEG